MSKKITCKTGANCSAVGCNNYQLSPDCRGISFYRYPTDPVKKELWTRALKRLDKTGNPWKPSSCSRLCSDHFLGGQKSNHINSPSYLPTIFPTGHKKPATEKDAARFERANRRLVAKEVSQKSQQKSQKVSRLEMSEATDSCDGDEFLERTLLNCSTQTTMSPQMSMVFEWTCDAPCSTEKGTLMSSPSEMSMASHLLPVTPYATMSLKAKAKCRPIYPCLMQRTASNPARTSECLCCAGSMKKSSILSHDAHLS